MQTTLGALVKQINGLFEVQLTDADLVGYAQTSTGKLLENLVLAREAAASSKELFLHGDFRKEMMTAVIESPRNHKAMSEQVLGRRDVHEGFASILLDLVYEGFRKKREEA